MDLDTAIKKANRLAKEQNTDFAVVTLDGAKRTRHIIHAESVDTSENKAFDIKVEYSTDW